MFLSGLGTASPSTRWTQLQCWDALVAIQLSPDAQPAIAGDPAERCFAATTGSAAGFSRSIISARRSTSIRTCSTRDSRRHAPAVAASAAERAIADAGLEPGDIDAVIISTCTGYLCPGLTSYVTERLGLPTDILALDLVGQGCGAALPNMRTGEALLASGRAEPGTVDLRRDLQRRDVSR